MSYTSFRLILLPLPIKSTKKQLQFIAINSQFTAVRRSNIMRFVRILQIAEHRERSELDEAIDW